MIDEALRSLLQGTALILLGAAVIYQAITLARLTERIARLEGRDGKKDRQETSR